MADPLQDAIDLFVRYEETGSQAELDRGIELLDRAAQRLPAGSPKLPPYLHALGKAYRMRFDARRNERDLEVAIHALGMAVQGLRADSADYAEYLDHLETARSVGYLAFGVVAQIDQAINAREGFLAYLSDDDPMRTRFIHNLAVDYRHRFEGEGNPADLERAGQLLAELREGLRPGDGDWCQVTLALADVMARRYDVGGVANDLQSAIALRADALRRAPDDYPGVTAQSIRLGEELMALNAQTGDPALLEQAIGVWDAATRAPDVDPLAVPRLLNNIGGLIAARYQGTSDLADLDDAISSLEDALVASDAAIRLDPAAADDRPRFAASLAGLLRKRFERRRDPADLRRVESLESPATSTRRNRK